MTLCDKQYLINICLQKLKKFAFAKVLLSSSRLCRQVFGWNSRCITVNLYRRSQELTFQRYEMGDMNNLALLITDPEIFLHLAKEARFDLIKYWNKVLT